MIFAVVVGRDINVDIDVINVSVVGNSLEIHLYGDQTTDINNMSLIMTFNLNTCIPRHGHKKSYKRFFTIIP